MGDGEFYVEPYIEYLETPLSNMIEMGILDPDDGPDICGVCYGCMSDDDCQYPQLPGTYAKFIKMKKLQEINKIKNMYKPDQNNLAKQQKQLMSFLLAQAVQKKPSDEEHNGQENMGIHNIPQPLLELLSTQMKIRNNNKIEEEWDRFKNSLNEQELDDLHNLQYRYFPNYGNMIPANKYNNNETKAGLEAYFNNKLIKFLNTVGGKKKTKKKKTHVKKSKTKLKNLSKKKFR